MICRGYNSLVYFNFGFLRSLGKHRESQGGDLDQCVAGNSMVDCSNPPRCSLYELNNTPEESEDDNFCPCCECNPCDCHR